MKRIFIVVILLSTSILVGWLYGLKSKPAKEVPGFETRTHVAPASPQVTREPEPIVVAKAEAFEKATNPAEPIGRETAPVSTIKPQSPPPAAGPKQQTAKGKSSKPPKPPLKDPLARVALSMVGFDPGAEEYWLMAINDPAITGEEKEDLIEDLNEEGFADPKNLTEDDIPLIVSRLDIIETYAPFAVDELNARSFAEAYKDLWNMLAKASER